MVGVLSLFVVVILSLLITRIATVMLTLTGLSPDSAAFQARSAFSGAGFTTSESEAVVNHPVRRRIIGTLVLLGNAGVVTVLVSLLLSFGDVEDSGEALTRIGLLVGGLLLLWLVARSRLTDRLLSGLIERALRRFTDLDTHDYVSLLHLSDDWVVGEVEVEAQSWLCSVPLQDLDLPEEGIVVLGIDRADGRWVGAPSGTTWLRPGDVAVLYGTRSGIRRIDARERTAEGELDRLSSQVDFTESFLAQQQMERNTEEMAPPDPDVASPTLGVTAEGANDGEPEPDGDQPAG